VHDEADLADAFEQALNAKKSLVLDVCTGNFPTPREAFARMAKRV
jgi:5-formyltetrahydrofolate cyclo-ligase